MRMVIGRGDEQRTREGAREEMNGVEKMIKAVVGQ